jgi:Protein of unknown function (DUF3352)
MTSTTHEHFDAPQGEPGSQLDGEAPRRGSRGKTVALVAGLLGIVGLGGGGAVFAWSALGGGGPQPESVLPADTIAFAKVDLDPSGTQKLDAIRFLRKFPQAPAGIADDADLREVIFQEIQRSGDVLKDVDYEKEVEPWLGKRFAVALLPEELGSKADGAPNMVAVLGVSDRDEAGRALDWIAGSDGAACELAGDFAVCGKDQASVAAVVAAGAKSPLTSDKAFTADMSALGEDGVAAAWVDLDKTADVADSLRMLNPASALGLSVPNARLERGGRVAMALRFDGPHLELAGKVNDAPFAFSDGTTGTGVGDLPEGTLAALGVANAGDQFRSSWPKIVDAADKSGGGQALAKGIAEAERELGVSIPDGLAKALGNQLTLAFGGMGEGQSTLKVAAVTDGDRKSINTIVDSATRGDADQIVAREDGARTILAISEDYAAELAAGAGLGSAKVFKDAVPGADGARFVLFVDIAGLLDAFPDEIGADTREDLAVLSAVGISASGTDTSADFRLRLTTR